MILIPILGQLLYHYLCFYSESVPAKRFSICVFLKNAVKNATAIDTQTVTKFSFPDIVRNVEIMGRGSPIFT